MDMIESLRAFVATADCGNFSSAARSLGLAPSVVTKRVNQLEETLPVKLFERSTRSVKLTETGFRHLKRAREIVSGVNELVSSYDQISELEDYIKIKVPTAMCLAFLGDILHEFCIAHPKVRMDVTVADGSMDPTASGLDLAFGAFPLTFEAVRDRNICKFDRYLCATPEYLEANGHPGHPRDLVHHSCLNFSLTGNTWFFETSTGPISIEVRPRFGANDSALVLNGVRRGYGIALASSYSVAASLRSGALVRVLEDFKVPSMWIRATFPERKTSPAVRRLVEFVQDAVNPVPPWERPDQASDAKAA